MFTNNLYKKVNSMKKYGANISQIVSQFILIILMMAMSLQLLEQTICAEAHSKLLNEQMTVKNTMNKKIYNTKSNSSIQFSDDSSDFVVLADEIPDILLDIRYYSNYNFVGKRIDGYEEPIALLTKEAAEALKEVSDDLLQKGYRLKIYDAYRPQQSVTFFKNWAMDDNDIKMKIFFYPDIEKNELIKKGYISEHSGHSRGSTVDLTLFDCSTGQDVDMGSPFDFFGIISHTDSNKISDEQLKNRKLLQSTMIAHGFKGISTEWWHFTLNNEPYPTTYFTFSVNSNNVVQ